MATAQKPRRVSSADFIRGFANWRLQAAREPVVVTHHGKDAHVLISLDDYRRLGDGALPTASLRDSMAGLVESIRDGVIVFSQPGALPAESLQSLIEQVRALDMDEVRGRITRSS